MFGGQEVEDKRFFQVSNRMRQQTMKMVAADAIGSPIVQMVASIALAVFLYVATIDSVKATLTAGHLHRHGHLHDDAAQAAEKPDRREQPVPARHHRLPEPVRSAGLQPEQDTGTRTLERARGEIEFRNVTFTYPTKDTPALHNVSFKVEAGKSVALVGRSGSGKSTIASL
jgi:subfamily B ATP-binding cassette protein MsbA